MSERASPQVLLAEDGSQRPEAAVTRVATEEALVQPTHTVGEGGRDEKADVVLPAEARAARPGTTTLGLQPRAEPHRSARPTRAPGKGS